MSVLTLGEIRRDVELLWEGERPGGGSAFIAQVTTYSTALGVAISQACYATGENHERAVLRQLLGELDLEGVQTHLDRFPGRTSRCDSSLRTTPEALLQLVRDRWSIERWHWIRDTQLHEDAHRYQGNGPGALATLRTTALNLLRLSGFQSIRAGIKTVTHDISQLLRMARRQPEPISC